MGYIKGERRVGERRQTRQPYDGPNRRSTTSRRADELEDLTDREREDLIRRLLEDEET